MSGIFQDPRFYPQARPVTASDIAALTKGELIRGGGDVVASVAVTPDAVKAGSVCFVGSSTAVATIPEADGYICLVSPELAESIPEGGVVITVRDPKGALGLVLVEMFPAQSASPGIDESASLDPSARFGDGVSIAAGAVVEADAEIGTGAVIGPGAVIGRGCVLGKGVVVGPHTVINYAIIGEGTEIGPSVIIGNRGFGISRDDANYPVPHLGRVVIGAGTYIAGHCNIDRGFLKDTVIGDTVMIDTMVHIAHNVSIGDGCIICGQSGIAGSVTLGRDNVMGSKSGIADNITIGDGNMFAALSGVTKNVGNGQVMGGFPAVPMKEFRRQAVALRQLGESVGKGGGNG